MSHPLRDHEAEKTARAMNAVRKSPERSALRYFVREAALDALAGAGYPCQDILDLARSSDPLRVHAHAAPNPDWEYVPEIRAMVGTLIGLVRDSITPL